MSAASSRQSISTTITANVQDQQGNGLLGVPISFSTTAGSLGATSVVSDSSGNASTTLTTTAGATVTASAGGGTSGTLSGTVAITVKPNLTVSITPQSGTITVSTPMTFTVGVGTNTVVTDVTVDFGDGSKVDLGPISQTQIVAHLYGVAGSLTASATATDAEGTKKTVTTPVIVSDFLVTLTSSGNTTLGNPVTFTATVTPSGVSVDSYIWDFGEGNTITTSSSQIAHVFTSRGTKGVKVTVVPTKGSPRSAITQLDIS